ncbi:MAG: methyltransferase domain-containing protein [Planctomycetes bacterium]|nr:methyltransferase domain-containing protein [Planctomycetota bacterium]
MNFDARKPTADGDDEHLSTRAGYDRWAEIYDVEDNPLIALEEMHIDALLGAFAGLDVLELGCGTGRHTVRLAAGGARLVAVDFAEEMVAKARAKPGWEHVRFVRHDLSQPLPLADAAFDRVCTFLVLDHLSKLGDFFCECRRVCRPGGRLIASVMHPAMILRGITAHFSDPRTGGDVYPASARNQISDYVSAALQSGWTIDHISEHAVGREQAAKSLRAAKYEGWPMLLLLRLSRSRSESP